jgi:fructuronate reductase
MKLTDVEALKKSGIEIELPRYDREELKRKTEIEPTWIHFGAGNIFRAFPAALLQELLNNGSYDRGVIVCEGFDHEIIDKAYKPFDNLSLLVVLKSDGTVDKKLIGSVTNSLCLGEEKPLDNGKINEIFRTKSLQMASFTITEKGYNPDGGLMGKIAQLLYERFMAGAYPIAMVSMDNCSHNGDKLKQGVILNARKNVEQGVMKPEFISYLEESGKVSFPWSMIDKITPRPDENVREMLIKDGIEDVDMIVTVKNTYTSSFVNAEETQYLVIEDDFPNGRPPLEKSGVIFTDRTTVDKVEKMKVCTCLNPLHTAMAIYGCLLGYDSIWKEMKDNDIKSLITKMGYEEGMPVVVNPGIISPTDFIGQVLNKRLPNPFMPDTPQRIASDTSQKIPIRFGETLKAYINKGYDVTSLIYIPLVLAGYLRYLLAVDDMGNVFEPSPDPLLGELRDKLSELKIGELPDRDKVVGKIMQVLSRKDIFPVDLEKCGLSNKITDMFIELCSGKGAVRATLHKYVS